MAAKKSARKSTRAAVHLKPLSADDPRRGRGPKKGAPNAGRPPDAFKAMLRTIGSHADLLRVVRAVVKDPTHPAWQKTVAMVWDRGYDKPAQALDVTSNGESLASFTLGIGTA